MVWMRSWNRSTSHTDCLALLTTLRIFYSHIVQWHVQYFAGDNDPHFPANCPSMLHYTDMIGTVWVRTCFICMQTNNKTVKIIPNISWSRFISICCRIACGGSIFYILSRNSGKLSISISDVYGFLFVTGELCLWWP